MVHHHPQAAVRLSSEQYGNEKKPLNPFLGELFLGKWEDEAGTTELISEQVSHHPPATAYSITNLDSGVHLEGFNAQKATFSRTINIKQIGHAVLTLPSPDAGKTEKYLITLPALHIEGLIFGAPFIELEGTSFITSSTGFTSKIDYSGKGWLSGKKNSVTASIYPTNKEKDVAYNITGVWTKSFEIHEGSPKHNSSKTLVETYDASEHPTSKLVVAPIDKQHPLESRRAWKGVADGIAKGDMDLVSREKSAIEKAQRELRAKEKAEGRTWERRYFTDRQADGDAALESLGPNVGLPATGDADKTGGLWRYDAEKADRVRSQPPLNEADQAKMAEEILGQKSV